MPRKKILSNGASDFVLESIIPQYAQIKEIVDENKKTMDALNKDIKKLMKEQNLQDKECGGYVAKYIVQKRESINEDMLLEIAHHYGIKEIVKTKEYIDFDALEKAIYNHAIDNSILIEMDKAREIKEVETLKITKVKEKGNE